MPRVIQKTMLSVAMFIISQIALAAYHESALGLITGCLIASAAWQMSDELIPVLTLRKEEDNPPLPIASENEEDK